MLTIPNKELYLKSQRGSGFFIDNWAQSRLEVTNRCFADNRNVPFYLEDKMPTGIYPRTEKHRLQSIKNLKDGMFGKHRSEITKQKISKAMRGENHYNWKGGKIKDSNGYILIKCRNHPHKNGWGYVREQRLVMEKYLGRYLKSEEVVHHINKNITDNRIENLKLFANQSEHYNLGHPRFIRLPKITCICGRVFQPPASVTKFCSIHCALINRHRKLKERRNG